MSKYNISQLLVHGEGAVKRQSSMEEEPRIRYLSSGLTLNYVTITYFAIIYFNSISFPLLKNAGGQISSVIPNFVL